MGMNFLLLTGRLTAAPELKQTAQKEKSYLRFSIAVNRTKNETDFFNCVAWEKTAELMAEYLKKGSLIALQGHVKNREYETEKKEKKRMTEVIVEKFEFLESKK